MLRQGTVDLIRQLFDDGVSQRRIACRMRVARETVRRILDGRRMESEACEDDTLQLSEGLPQRCPSCGGLVYMPCLGCRARVFKGERL